MQLFTVSTKNVFLVFLLHQLFSFQNLRSKLQLFKWSESFFYYFVIAAIDCFLSLTSIPKLHNTEEAERESQTVLDLGKKARGKKAATCSNHKSDSAQSDFMFGQSS